MFQSISWQEFLTAIAFIAGGYYALTTLLLYRVEIANIFEQKKSKAVATEISDDQTDSNEVNDLMGGIKFESEVNVPHEISVESDEVNVQVSKEVEDPIEASDPLTEAFGELQNEIKIIAEGLSPECKDESIVLFKSLLSRYPPLAQTEHAEKINHLLSELIKAKCSIQFESNEIKSWWAEVEISSSNHQ